MQEVQPSAGAADDTASVASEVVNTSEVVREQTKAPEPANSSSGSSGSSDSSGSRSKGAFSYRRAILYALLAFASFFVFFTVFDIEGDGSLVFVDVPETLKEIWVPRKELDSRKKVENDWLDNIAHAFNQTATCFFWDKRACENKPPPKKILFRIPKWVVKSLQKGKEGAKKLRNWKPVRAAGEGLRRTAKFICTPIRAARGGFKNLKELIGNVKEAFSKLGSVFGSVGGWVDEVNKFVERPKVKVVVNAIKYVVLPLATAVKFILPFIV